VLRGQFEVTIDDKGRLVIPSRSGQLVFAVKREDEQGQAAEREIDDSVEKEGKKKENGGRLLIAPDVFDLRECLLLYPVDKWEEVERQLKASPSQDKDIEPILDLVTDVILDSKGRFTIPECLLAHIGLDLKELPTRKFYLIVKHNKCELWLKEFWDAQYLRAKSAITVKQKIQAMRKAAVEEAMQDVMKEITEDMQEVKKAMKEAMKEELKQALLSESKSQVWSGLSEASQA